METEVFRLSTFEKNVNYSFAMRTRTEGGWPNQKHFTTNQLQLVGKHVNSSRWGYGDQSGGSELFEYNGIQTNIIYDYEGNTCFKIETKYNTE
jgi:hypothetical protein